VVEAVFRRTTWVNFTTEMGVKGELNPGSLGISVVGGKYGAFAGQSAAKASYLPPTTENPHEREEIGLYFTQGL
jgi:hypothetical protein